MCHGIAIVGANGSGKTTLGRALASLSGFRHMDIEDYAFQDTAVPYAQMRTQAEIRALLLADIQAHPAFVLSAVNCDFGREINSRYGLILYLKTSQDVRLARIKQRSAAQFGERMLPGGDLYEHEARFLAFAAARTMERTDAWLQTVRCPVLTLDGAAPVAENAALAKAAYEKLHVRAP